MRGRIRVVLLMTVLATAMAIPATASAAEPADVNGLWTSVDTVDGSNQAMLVRVRANGNARIVLFDDDGAVCGGGSPLVAIGRGSLDGDDVTVDFRIFCFNGVTATATVTYSYDAGPPATLTDDFGAVWTRF